MPRVAKQVPDPRVAAADELAKMLDKAVGIKSFTADGTPYWEAVVEGYRVALSALEASQ